MNTSYDFFFHPNKFNRKWLYHPSKPVSNFGIYLCINKCLQIINLFTDKPPFAVWLGTESGYVEILLEGHERTIPKIHIPGNVKQIEYLYANDDIFVLDGKGSVFRFYFTVTKISNKILNWTFISFISNSRKCQTVEGINISLTRPNQLCLL